MLAKSEKSVNEFKIIGKIEKISNAKGIAYGFGVKTEITFPSGEKRDYTYVSFRKKDLVRDMENGKLARWIDCARIDTHTGNLVFQLGLY